MSKLLITCKYNIPPYIQPNFTHLPGLWVMMSMTLLLLHSMQVTLRVEIYSSVVQHHRPRRVLADPRNIGTTLQLHETQQMPHVPILPSRVVCPDERHDRHLPWLLQLRIVGKSMFLMLRVLFCLMFGLHSKTKMPTIDGSRRL